MTVPCTGHGRGRTAAVSCRAMLAVALDLGPAALRGSPRAGNFLNSR